MYLIILLFYLTAYILNFNVITILFQNLLLFLGIAIIVIIQPELRKMIEKLGSKDFNISLKNIIALIFKDRKPKDTVQRLSDFSIQEIVRGCSLMGKAKTGALIVIECKTPLNEYVESGIKVNADITSQLFINIFEKNTPLHDGAVIIQNNRISAATCYLPLSDSKRINKDLGTRHRAGIGISEVTDSLTVIVSEETGAISVARNGKLLHNIDREKLAEELDVTVPLISRVERGYVQVSLQRLGQIAECLNMSLEELITGVSKSKQNYLGQELQTIIGRSTPDKLKLIYYIAKIIERAKFV